MENTAPPITWAYIYYKRTHTHARKLLRPVISRKITGQDVITEVIVTFPHLLQHCPKCQVQRHNLQSYSYLNAIDFPLSAILGNDNPTSLNLLFASCGM